MRSSPCRAALREETYAIQQNQVAKRGGTSEEVDEGNRDKLSGNAGSGFPREAGGSTGAVEIRGCLAAASTGRARTARRRKVRAAACGAEGAASGTTAKLKHSVRRCGNIWECGIGSLRPPGAAAAVRSVRSQRRWYVMELKSATGRGCLGRSAAALAHLVLLGVCCDGHGIRAQSAPSRLTALGQPEQRRTIGIRINREAGSPIWKG